jgi:hypothetical protein
LRQTTCSIANQFTINRATKNYWYYSHRALSAVIVIT